MRLHKSAGDSSVWIVCRDGDDNHTCQGWVAIYVDDFLGAGKGDVPSAVYNAVEWRVGVRGHGNCGGVWPRKAGKV